MQVHSCEGSCHGRSANHRCGKTMQCQQQSTVKLPPSVRLENRPGCPAKFTPSRHWAIADATSEDRQVFPVRNRCRTGTPRRYGAANAVCARKQKGGDIKVDVRYVGPGKEISIVGHCSRYRIRPFRTITGDGVPRRLLANTAWHSVMKAVYGRSVISNARGSEVHMRKRVRKRFALANAESRRSFR